MILDVLQRIRQEAEHINDTLQQAIERADVLQQKQELLMKTAAEFAALLEKMDVETTRIGDKFTDLFDKLKAGGLSTQEEEAIFAQAEELSARLTGLGHDPENPIPPEA